MLEVGNTTVLASSVGDPCLSALHGCNHPGSRERQIQPRRGLNEGHEDD